MKTVTVRNTADKKTIELSSYDENSDVIDLHTTLVLKIQQWQSVLLLGRATFSSILFTHCTYAHLWQE